MGSEHDPLGPRAGGHVAEAGAGLRLGQAHAAEPATGELVPREAVDLLRRAVRHQQAGVPGGQHRVGADRHAALEEVGVGGHLHHAGQLHAADVGVLRRGQHARRRVGIGRGPGALGQVHALAVEARLLHVGGAVGGLEGLAGDALAGVEHRVEGVAAVLGEAQALRQRLDAQPVVQQEIERRAKTHGELAVEMIAAHVMTTGPD